MAITNNHVAKTVKNETAIFAPAGVSLFRGEGVAAGKLSPVISSNILDCCS
jgi:hypothetical protein